MFWQQSLAILDKNIIIKFRNKKQLLGQLLTPVVTALFLVLSQTENKSTNSFFLTILPLYLPSSVNGFTRRLLVNFVNEKKEKFKETQKIMGCKQYGYIGGWFLTLYFEAFVVAAIIIGAIIYIDVNISVITLCFLYFSFVMAVTHQTFFLTTFFNSPKLAGELGSFIQTIAVLLYYYLQSKSSKILGILILLFPQPALAQSLMPYLQDENSIVSIAVNKNYMDDAKFMLVFDVFFYFFLYLYCDQVVKNEYGIQKHPLFFLDPVFRFFGIRRQNNQTNAAYHNFSIQEENNLGIELATQNNQILNQVDIQDRQNEFSDFSSAKYHEKYDFFSKNLQPTIKIQNLNKVFKTQSKEINAVNSLSIQLYNKNIFCLLGHNGSGKTTFINLLTGMIKKNSGQIQFSNHGDLDFNYDNIRQNIGLCSQKDVLYDDLTVVEHLRFYGKLKGKKGQQLEDEIFNIIPKIGLQQEFTKQAKNLSGGNKRKLSLGMALIGSSKIILLDEPTSGMDSISRRQLWDILETIKEEQRTIILTTHHLEEAEALADRIGIMNKGKLVIVGSSDFIKKNFGVGYHLYLNPKYNKDQQFIENKQQFIQIVNKYIPDNQVETQTQKNQLKITLPFKSQDQFIHVFEELEQFDFLSINLEMNTLEETFINIEQKSYEENEGDSSISIGNGPFSYNERNILTFQPKTYILRQSYAMFVRQIRLIIRNWEAWIMIILPILFIIFGVFVTKQLYDFLMEQLEKLLQSKKQAEVEILLKELNKFTMGLFSQIVGFFIVYSYCLNSSVFILTPVWEKEKDVKYIMNVMGTKTLSYWLGTFLADYLCFLVPFICFVLSLYYYDVEFLIPYLWDITKLITIFGVTMMTYTYLSSFMFNQSNSAFKYFPLFNMFLNFTAWYIIEGAVLSYKIPTQIVEVAQNLCSPFMVLQKCFGKLQDNVNVSDYLQGEINNFENIEIQQPESAPGKILRRFLQQIKLGQNMNQQQNDLYEQETEQQHLREQQMKEWKLFDSQNAYIFWLIFDALIYILLIWYLDNRQKQIKKCNNSKVIDQFQNQQNQNIYHSQFIENNEDNQGQSNLVQSVQNEQQRVIQNNFEDQIQMIDVHKVYPNNFYALKGISFGVKKGEIFALLGPNGAGKSSTFNLLTAKLARTRGSIYLNHLPIEQGFHFSNNIGICPQKDSLWENLSPIEHIKLFARIKGMNPQEAQNATEFFIKYLDLIDNQNNMANNLSGGNKRRLCVAISMIGAPQLGFFDEPSTGLDPISKRYLWNLLQQSNQENNSSFLLTTHSMPEAESLCQRIGILINGQFRCIDTLQNLKQTYGKGIYLKIKELPGRYEQVDKIIKQEIQNIQQIEENHQILNYLIPFQNYSFYKIFKVLQHLKEDLKIIDDFSLSQSTLEQIFLQFAEQQQQNPLQHQVIL